MDRAAQVAACEFLHAAILWIIGVTPLMSCRSDCRDSATVHVLIGLGMRPQC